MTPALKIARTAALFIPLLLSAACTTAPGLEEGLGFSAQQSIATQSQSNIVAYQTAGETGDAAAIPIPQPNPAETAQPPLPAPAYAQASTESASTTRLTQVASLEPAPPLAQSGIDATPIAFPATSPFPDYRSRGHAFLSRDHECLARAMFFESNRSSRDGLIAVGSVVMNRLEDGKWGNTVCQVVGAPKQFAPGVLSRRMDSAALPDVMEAAQAVLKGERHPKIYKQVMFFHTAGYRYPYDNMHYVVAAGGNSFYEKRRRMRGMNNTPQSAVLAAARTRGSFAARSETEAVPDKRVLKASLQKKPSRKPAEPAAEASVEVKAATVKVIAAQPAAFVMPSAERFAAFDAPSASKGGRVHKPATGN